MSELPSVSPEAYLERNLYPTPTPEQNLAWRGLVIAGQSAQCQLESLAGAEETAPGNSAEFANLKAAAEAGLAARNEMWQANLKLVDYFIDASLPDFGKGRTPIRGYVRQLRRFVSEALELHPTLELEDVRQWGRIGLFQATGRWDPDRADFAGAVYPAVRDTVRRGFMNEGSTIRIKSVNSATRGNLSDKRKQAYDNDLEAGYSDELANMREHPDYAQTVTVSLDWRPDMEGLGLDEYRQRFIPDDEIGLAPAVDVMAPSWSDEAGLSYTYRRDYIDGQLAKLKEQQRQVVTLYYGLDGGQPRTYDEIGTEFNVSRQRIGQILPKARANLREQMGVELPVMHKPEATATTPTPSPKPEPDPQVALAARDLPQPQPALAELPKFSLSEDQLGMTHQQWLNLALEHIYSVWHEARTQGRAMRYTHIKALLGNTSILQTLSSHCDLIVNHVSNYGKTEVSPGCLTADGARFVIEAYRKQYMGAMSWHRYQQRQSEPA